MGNRNVAAMSEARLRAHVYHNPCPIAQYEAEQELRRRGVVLP